MPQIRTMDALSDWDEWDDDGVDWWLQFPLHAPRGAIDGDVPYLPQGFERGQIRDIHRRVSARRQG